MQVVELAQISDLRFEQAEPSALAAIVIVLLCKTGPIVLRQAQADAKERVHLLLEHIHLFLIFLLAFLLLFGVVLKEAFNILLEALLVLLELDNV